jgi:hypothetical protein
VTDDNLFARNRVILSHFDSYSASLVFARFGKTLVAPQAPPDGAAIAAAPHRIDEIHAGDAVARAIIVHYGLNAAEVFREPQFDAWLKADGQTIRIHLLRFRTFRAPAEVLEPHGGVFSPISELRGAATVELALLREVFNLILGGDQKRG